MTTDAPDGRADPIDAIFRSLDDAEWGRRNLPRLVSLLTHDAVRVRTGAGWAITYVAEKHPDSAAYLIRRLGDRMTDDEVSLSVEQTFLGVAARYPAVVDDELPDVLEGDDAVRRFERDLGGSMLRAEYAMGGSPNRDVGRVRFPEGGEPGDGQVFTSDERSDQWRMDLDGHGDEDEAEDETVEGDGADDGSAAEAIDQDDGQAGGPTGRPARELWAETDDLAVITANCRFDDLAVMAQRHRGRYADIYRSRADLDDEEHAVGLLLFHLPDENVSQYVTDVAEPLDQWQFVDGVDGVRTLYDWGQRPRPWALVEYADKDLRKRSRFSTDEALWNARHLAASLAHVHENGVVHAGIDPGTVSYHENLLDPEERQIPMLTNVGLLAVVRQYFDPTRRLDPRYAPPEYFDRRFGRIDHAADIYGIGAVCYHLFTGRPPYRGDYAAVRDAVLSPEPPKPSAVADVPEGIDDVVGKAMATEKLHRYEGVTHMAADLRSVAERGGIGAIYGEHSRSTAGREAAAADVDQSASGEEATAGAASDDEVDDATSRPGVSDDGGDPASVSGDEGSDGDAQSTNDQVDADGDTQDRPEEADGR